MDVHLRKVHRKPSSDYADGYYFVTVCTHNFVHSLGEIVDSKLVPTVVGGILDRCINEITQHYHYIEVVEYVVMPNHWHALFWINAPDIALDTTEDKGCLHAPAHEIKHTPFAKRTHFNSLLARAVGGVKSAVTRKAKSLGLKFKWQRGFYDNIVTHQEMFDKICYYIENNPESWELDRFYKNAAIGI